MKDKPEIKCENCGVEIPSNSKYCLSCGKSVDGIEAFATLRTRPKNSGNKIIYAIVVVCCVNIFLKFFGISKKNEKSPTDVRVNYADSIGVLQKRAKKFDSMLNQIESSNYKTTRSKSEINIIQDSTYFYSNKHPKAKGLKFLMKKPEYGFEQLEGNRPNVVQKWEKDRYDNSKYVSIVLIVKYLDDDLSTLTKSKLKDYLKKPEIRSFMTKGLNNVNNYKFIMIDNYPGIYFEYFTVEETLDESIKIYSASYNVFVDGKIVNLQLLSPSHKSMDVNLLKFKELATSLVFVDQYN